MNKLTKGAFAMVLAGSVTFSVTNALLAEQPIKRLVKEIALPIAEAAKKMDVISKAEKSVKEQTPATNRRDDQTKLVAVENNNKSGQALKANQQNTINLSNRSTTNAASTSAPTIAKKPVTSSKVSTTTVSSKPAGKTTTTVGTTKPATNAKEPTTNKPAASAKAPTTSKPVTSAKAPATKNPATSTKAPTTTTAAKPTGSNTTSATKLASSRGQQVSQEAKEKAESRKDNKKETNVNNM